MFGPGRFNHISPDRPLFRHYLCLFQVSLEKVVGFRGAPLGWYSVRVKPNWVKANLRVHKNLLW